MKTYGHFINGTYFEPVDGKFIDSFNPYSGEVWARIPGFGANDLDTAVFGIYNRLICGNLIVAVPPGIELWTRALERTGCSLTGTRIQKRCYQNDYWRTPAWCMDRGDGRTDPILVWCQTMRS